MKQNDKPDQSFDSIAKKFESNIYGSTKGKLRHELLLYYISDNIDLNSAKLSILDAGGGTGVMSDEFLKLGHDVVLNDISPESLEMAKSKIGEHPDIDYSLSEIRSLNCEKKFDFVICHAVLEWLNKPLDAVDHLLELIKPGGHLSLSFFNRDAKLFGNLLYGNFDYVSSGMVNKNTVRLNPDMLLTPKDILRHLESKAVSIIHRAGIRCIHDYLQDRTMQTSRYDELKEMEITFGKQHPYCWLGKYFHLIIVKN